MGAPAAYDGDDVGLWVGAIDGAQLGLGVGWRAVYVGDCVGDTVGDAVGWLVGEGVGDKGEYEGDTVGDDVVRLGMPSEAFDGSADGALVGL